MQMDINTAIEQRDFVQHKDGGPIMYVMDARDPTAILCSWNASKNKKITYLFSSGDLIIKDKYLTWVTRKHS